MILHHRSSYIAYFAYLARKTTMDGGSALFMVSAVSCSAMTLIGGTATIACLIFPPLWDITFQPLLFSLVMGSAAFACFRLGNRAADIADKLEPIVVHSPHPLSDHTTLVRASAKQQGDEEQSLLRPMQATQESLAIELVRPTALLPRNEEQEK